MSEKQEQTTAAQAQQKAVTVDEFAHAMSILEQAVRNHGKLSFMPCEAPSEEMVNFNDLWHTSRYESLTKKKAKACLIALEEVWPKVKDQFHWPRIGQLKYEEAKENLKDSIKHGGTSVNDDIRSARFWSNVALVFAFIGFAFTILGAILRRVQ